MKTTSNGFVTFDALTVNDPARIILTFGVYPHTSQFVIAPEDADDIIKAIRAAQEACHAE